jgi:hypothetical protein
MKYIYLSLSIYLFVDSIIFLLAEYKNSFELKRLMGMMDIFGERKNE